MSKDTALNMELFKESEWWKLISEHIQSAIDERVDILLWTNNPNIIDSDMNKIQFTKYDLLRLEINILKAIKSNPDDIINYHTAVITNPIQD